MADTATPNQTPGVAPVVAHRSTPPGVLPRRGQMWLMLGVAGGIVTIILLTGHEPAPPRAAAGLAREALAPNADQLTSYKERLRVAETRPRPGVTATSAPSQAELRPVQPDDRAGTEQRAPRSDDGISEERRRREYESLFASNVVQSPNPTLATEAPRAVASSKRGAGGAAATDLTAGPPSLDDVAAAVVRASTAGRSAEPVSSVAPAAGTGGTAISETTAADGPLHRILEGTVIDTVLTNRLDGTVAAPVNCLVSTPIYAATDQQVLIPAGSRILGSTKPVQALGETRLAVAFTRLVMPNGRTYSLNQFMGLNEIGDAGLRDQVNQHYATTFGASAAVGLISGLAQFLGSGFGSRTSAPIIVTGSVGDSTAQATSQTMGRFLNRLPSITIREGHRVKAYLTSDLQLPVYRVSPVTREPGMRLAGKGQL